MFEFIVVSCILVEMYYDGGKWVCVGVVLLFLIVEIIL